MPENLVVRMYNIRFGDAILVTIPDKNPSTGRTTTRRILIDVGNAPTVAGTGQGGSDAVFEGVVGDILDQLDGHPLDLYVITHEHLDHVQGLMSWDPCMPVLWQERRRIVRQPRPQSNGTSDVLLSLDDFGSSVGRRGGGHPVYGQASRSLEARSTAIVLGWQVLSGLLAGRAALRMIRREAEADYGRGTACVVVQGRSALLMSCCSASSAGSPGGGQGPWPPAPLVAISASQGLGDRRLAPAADRQGHPGVLDGREQESIGTVGHLGISEGGNGVLRLEAIGPQASCHADTALEGHI